MEGAFLEPEGHDCKTHMSLRDSQRLSYLWSPHASEPAKNPEAKSNVVK